MRPGGVTHHAGDNDIIWPPGTNIILDANTILYQNNSRSILARSYVRLYAISQAWFRVSQSLGGYHDVREALFGIDGGR